MIARVHFTGTVIWTSLARSDAMENSFMHRGCAISMNAVRKQDGGDAEHVEVAVLIEEIATARVLFRENRRVESTEKEPIAIEHALNQCAREARQLIDGKRAN
jgi:hypothetical protein